VERGAGMFFKKKSVSPLIDGAPRDPRMGGGRPVVDQPVTPCVTRVTHRAAERALQRR
jgi:hypothetical protein